jgi:LPXTG-motif cell wall-anchored protein
MDIAFFLVGLSLAVLAALSFFKRGKEKVKKIRNK